MRQEEERVARAAGPSWQSSDQSRLLGRRAMAALAGLLGVLAFAGPAAASTAKKAPAGTSRDANGKLHDDASGQFANDPCAIGEDGTEAMRARFRKAMSCGTMQQAHHVVPLQLRNLPELVAAAKSGWDINGKLNGICLDKKIHNGCHGVYSEDVRTRIQNLSLSKLASKKMASAIEMLVGELKAGLRSRRKPLK